MERLLLMPTVDRYDGYNSTKTSPTPFDNHISLRDSNEMFALVDFTNGMATHSCYLYLAIYISAGTEFENATLSS